MICNNVVLLLGDISVRKALEGNVSIACRDLLAQMINGNSVNIYCKNSAAVAAIYSSNSEVTAEGGVKVDLSHGHIKVKLIYYIYNRQ